jgi:hypothetical protein
MSTYGDIWAVNNAAAVTDYFRAAATHGAAASFTILKSGLFALAGAPNGAGYRVTITSNGDVTSVTYTITGAIVGQQSGTTVATIAGGNNTTVTTTQYWSRIDSITANNSSSAVTVAVGFAAGFALPRCRIKSLTFIGASSAGSIAFNMNSTSGVPILIVDTPALGTSYGTSVYIPDDGILVGRSAANDFAICTATQVTKFTVFCG